MDKKRMTQLIKLADEVLVSSGIKQQNSNDIKDSYNGQTAAFGITVLMSGLVPALVIYYQDANENREINRRAILQGGLDHYFKVVTAVISWCCF